MTTEYDAIIIGGGHNGLTAAAYLAKAGRKVLVLERRHLLGGAAVTEEIFPGFKYNMMDLQAAIGLHQLARLHENLKRRNEIWQIIAYMRAGFPQVDASGKAMPPAKAK